MSKTIVPSSLTVKRSIINAKQESTSTSAGKGSAKTPPAPAKSAKPAPAVQAEPKTGINTGLKTGMRVMAFQDETLATNDLPRRPAPLTHIPTHLTDTEMAKVWREEFPNSRAVLNGRITEAIVRGVRNLFNQGTGGHGTPGKTQSSQPYTLDDKGRRVASVYTRARKEKEETPAPAKATGTGKSAPAPAKGKSTMTVKAKRPARAA